MTRRRTRVVKVGAVCVGGQSPVSVQTMLDDDPHDVDSIVAHIESCRAAGADIVRLALPDEGAVATLAEVKRRTKVPLVADIHFDYRLAIGAVEAGADALRINPGNIGPKDRVREVAHAAAQRGVPIRIGVNGGSLESGESLVSSAMANLKVLEEEGFRDVVLSVKASNALETIEAYRELAALTDCPFHLGLTEAGVFLRGAVHSSVALGILLSGGIGDTIRVSLTDTPEKEARTGLEILRALGLRKGGVSVTSCPTCGRTKVGLKRVAEEVEAALGAMLPVDCPPVGVAVMGCAVNGPGEAKGADVALCGGDGDFVLYERGVFLRRVAQAGAVQAVVEAVGRLVAAQAGS